MKLDSTLTALFAADIAIWLRVHCDDTWTADNEAVQLLAARLVRVAQNVGDERIGKTVIDAVGEPHPFDAEFCGDGCQPKSSETI